MTEVTFEFDESTARHGMDWQWYRDAQTLIIARHSTKHGVDLRGDNLAELVTRNVFAANDHTWCIEDPLDWGEVMGYFVHCVEGNTERMEFEEGSDEPIDIVDEKARGLLLGDEPFVFDTISIFSGIWAHALMQGQANPDAELFKNYSPATEQDPSIPPVEERIEKLLDMLGKGPNG